jgi:pentatricopeptide repeat protein
MTALSVYEWMKAPGSVGGAGLSPTVYTYTAAMRAALAAGLLDRALAVWEDAQAAECPLDCRLCITYIEVRGGGGGWRVGFMVWQAQDVGSWQLDWRSG